jgi:hypothetical protein
VLKPKKTNWNLIEKKKSKNLTSCGGTLNVAVRKSTLMLVSTQGKTQNKPGPFAPPSTTKEKSLLTFTNNFIIPGNIRPRRKITARSYS